MTPEQIDFEQNAAKREISSLRGQVLLLGVLLLVGLLLCIIMIAGMNSRFPMRKHVYTSNAAAVCSFAPLDERGDITDAAVLNFAVLAAVDIHTFDYINWRKTLDAVTIARFTPDAREATTTALRDSGVLTSVVNNAFVLKAVLSGPARVIRSGVMGDSFTWEVEIPLTLAYTGGRASANDRATNYRPENRTVVLTVRRAIFTADNPDGLLVAGIASTQTMQSSGTDLPGQAEANQ